MLTGLFRLTWLELRIFLREPLGAIGSIAIPVMIFVVVNRLGAIGAASRSTTMTNLLRVDLPVFTAMLIAISAVLSLVTIIAIYREGGILKRLRATPLRPQTILAAHVIVKLFLAAVTMAAMAMAGRRYIPPGVQVPWVSFGAALLISTAAILSLGFVIASIVPTARFAQPVGALVLYPMIGLSGLFVPVASLPPPLAAVARWLPLTFAASLMQGIWKGEPWSSHAGDIAGLAVVFVVCILVSAKVFRWE